MVFFHKVSARSFIEKNRHACQLELSERSVIRFERMRTVNLDLQARRRQEILSAAIGCFTKHGFHQSSMKDIAAASGLSMGLLYRYFKNKQAIVHAVANLERDKTLAAIAAVPMTGFTKRNTVARAWAVVILEVVQESIEPSLMRLVHEVVAEAGRVPELYATLHALDEAISSAIEARIHEQKQRGFWAPKVDAAAVAQVILLLSDGLISRHWSAPREAQCVTVTHVTKIIDSLSATRASR
jgi:AcrR family transcriptional regulator